MFKQILFFCIIFIATVLRFSFLSSVPPSPSLDEATIGWNAYSILHTGRDEYGNFFPILLRAYDDYRPALYVYLVIPFVKFFGLQVLSVRLPSVIMSIATVIMSFFLIKNLLPNLKKRESIAFATMFLLAISPWHVYASRLGHEVNLGLTLVVLGILLFLIGINRKNSLFITFSFIVFGLSFYSYQSEKIFIPLILLILCGIFFKQLLTWKKQSIVSIALFIVISLPIFFASLSPGALLRLKGTSIFTDNSAYSTSAKQLLIARKKHNIVSEVVNNRRIITGEIFLQNYFSHFNPLWLFSNSGNEPFKAPNTGLLFLWEAPFLLIGIIWFLISRQISWRIKVLVIGWICADFVAPGLTTQAPHALRSYTLLPLPQILVACGIFFSLSFLQKQSRGISLAFLVIVAVVAAQMLLQFVNNYYVVFPITQSESFQYVLQHTMEYVSQNKKHYATIVVSNTDNLYQSYMFYLFYTAYDPNTYLAAGGTKSGGFNKTHTIDNIIFRPISYATEKSGTLLVGNPYDFPSAATPQFTSYYLDGKPGVTIAVK